MVLIIDDELLIRWTLAQVLNDAGFEVREASTGREAREAFGRGDVDLVLLDMRLPDVHGLTLLERFQAQDPSVPVIIMSAHIGPEDESKAMHLGAREIVRKPFNLTHMVDRVGANVAAVSVKG